MKEISRHILSIIILIGCILGMESCINDNAPDCDGTAAETQDKEQLRLVLRISSLDAGDSQSSNVTEKIKSLRVIILNEKPNGDKCLECNKKLETDFNANQFQHIFTWSTIEGRKHFYLIANEESVQSVKTSSEEEPKSLSDLLDSYTPDTTKTTNFAEVIKSVYFEPESAYNISNNSRYLPYTAYYYGYDIKKGEHLAEIPYNMYLVPVATKFTFNFTNKRVHDVSINEISVTPINSENFLIAHVGQSDIRKDFDEEKELYWIDWLAKVSEKSHQEEDYNDNMSFNQKYGWIADYEIPSSTKPNTQTLIEQKQNISVPGMGEEGTIPEKLQLGPYYLPESKSENANTVNNVTEYNYYLTLDLEDKMVENRPEFKNVKIDNLKSLFRNTSVIINIIMSEGDVEVYTEIFPWTRRLANGWVVEGGDSN